MSDEAYRRLVSYCAAAPHDAMANELAGYIEALLTEREQLVEALAQKEGERERTARSLDAAYRHWAAERDYTRAELGRALRWAALWKRVAKEYWKAYDHACDDEAAVAISADTKVEELRGALNQKQQALDEAWSIIERYAGHDVDCHYGTGAACSCGFALARAGGG